MNNIEIVDTHVHFWDPSILEYPWLKDAPVLDDRFSLDEFKAATEGFNIKSKVFVECNCNPVQNVQEVDWIESLAQSDSGIKGIVAYADMLDHETLQKRLDDFKTRPLVKGIRHNIQFNPAGFATDDDFAEGVSKVLNSGLHFELCLTHDQLDECIELVKRLPSGPLIIDHCAKPGIKAGLIDDWKKGMEELAENENVYCKISGLLTEADHTQWKSDEFRPYMDHVLHVFGIDRILFGGDWPVSTLAGGYMSWCNVIDEWTKHWEAKDKNQFFVRNAEKFYRL